MRIGILAGGGRLPLMIAESVAARGEGVHIVGILGEADRAIERFPHTWVNWGQIGRMVATLRAQSDELVIAGGVTRPDLRKVRPDAGFFFSLPQIVALVAAGGDDAVLTRVVRFFEQKGLKVRGAHEVAPDLLAGVGRLGGLALPDHAIADARIGFAVRRVLGQLDAGQAVVVGAGKVLAIEGAEGTDGMLQRVAGISVRRNAGERSGVLAKGPKPGQELRIDMPAIGPNTVAGAVAAGLSGIAVEAGSVLVLDREETLRSADASGCAVFGLTSDADASHVSAPAIRRRALRVIGGLNPGSRHAGDIERGLAVVERLAPFSIGSAAVVARAHIIAIEAGEGVATMLARVRALRQWGSRQSRQRVGVLVLRNECVPPEERTLQALLAQALGQGLAGAAIVGPSKALEAYAMAARLADDAGLFLVTCETVDA